jgi:hypothetical protein
MTKGIHDIVVAVTTTNDETFPLQTSRRIWLSPWRFSS